MAEELTRLFQGPEFFSFVEEDTPAEGDVEAMKKRYDRKFQQMQDNFQRIIEENGNIKKLLKQKTKQILQMNAENEKLVEKVTKSEEIIQKWHKLKSNRPFFEGKLLENDQEKVKREQMEIELWKANKIIAEGINTIADLEITEKVGSGCDGIVFLCSSKAKGIETVALKIVFNMGVETKEVLKNFYNNEFEILKSLPFHKNVIPILNEFHDRPTDPFFRLFPDDLLLLASHPNKTRRMTTCILMPSFQCFANYFRANFDKISLLEKFRFISEVLEGLVFLFEHDVVHLDMKLNNLLLSSNGRIVICDFGSAKKLSPEKKCFLPNYSSIGGNLEHLAPEIKSLANSVPAWIDYSKQPSFEVGMLAHEILFGQTPEGCYGEQMDEKYFSLLCADDSYNIPNLFTWLKSVLLKDHKTRLPLAECKIQFDDLYRELRLAEFIQQFYPDIDLE